MSESIDNLFKNTLANRGSFKFDKNVARVFDDMINRSVPGYGQILELLPLLTSVFRKPSKNYYDLGCSTGAGLIALAQGLERTKATLIGVDNSEAMLEQAKKNLQLEKEHELILRNDDITQMSISSATMVLMNFTLQFIALEKRDQLINNIYAGLDQGGVLVLSEKCLPEEPEAETLLTHIHHRFKSAFGYSDLEISNKRDAIENVLVPETISTHKQRLTEAGFGIVTPWIQNLQFVSLLAIK